MTQFEWTFPPLPELRTTTVFARTIRYYDVGQGPPLVLIHGVGGDADDWAFCIGPLSKTYRVIALDLLGFGRSDKPCIEYHIAGFVEILDRFLKGLGVERAHLLGGSLGGWIAASFALRFPGRVDKLVLADAAGVWGDITALPIDLRVSTRDHMREVFEFVFHDRRMASPILVDLAYQQHLERGDGYTIDSVLRNLHSGRERLDDVIGTLQTPTLIIWGQQDRMIPLEVGQRLHQLIAGSKLAVIADCGHLPELEKPAEFVRLVQQFLA